jgi:c-di-GMP-binding flagellar brake protein YcgR
MVFDDSGVNRRKFERYPLWTTARIELSSKKVLDVRTVDVGQGGMGIIAGVNPKFGTTFKVILRLPVKPAVIEPFEVKVRVVHSVFANDHGGFKIGLQFVELDNNAESTLQGFIKYAQAQALSVKAN